MRTQSRSPRTVPAKFRYQGECRRNCRPAAPETAVHMLEGASSKLEYRRRFTGFRQIASIFYDVGRIRGWKAAAMACIIREGDLACDRLAFIELIRRHLTARSDDRRFDWLYLQNP